MTAQCRPRPAAANATFTFAATFRLTGVTFNATLIAMQTFESFPDFVSWATSQAQAARMLGCSRANVNRILLGKQAITPDIAEKCEQVSHGLFRKERILWPEKAA